MKSNQLFLAAITLAMAIGAKAEPTLYPRNLDVLGNIKNKTDSNILADEQDARTVWVLPPNTAKATVNGLHSKTANMGFCAEMRDLQTSSRELTREIVDLQKRRKSKLDELVKYQEKAAALSQDAETYAAQTSLQALNEVDNRISSMETRLTDLYTAANECKTACDEINTEIQTVIASKKTAMKDRNDLARSNTKEIREYTKKRKAADAALKFASEVGRVYTDMGNELGKIRAQFHEQFASFGKMGGARASFTYSSHWNQNLDSLRAENPGINFSKMATLEAKLMTELAGVEGVDPTAAIMSIATAGPLKNGVAEYASYPESLESNVVLSLLGACPMEHPEYFDLKENDVKNMRYGLIISYNYETVFNLQARAEYNMYKMYEKIVKSGKRGGLFSSKSWSRVEERNFFRDSFKVYWSDKENVLTAEEKLKYEDQMRSNVMTRLATLALPTIPNRAEILAAGPAPQNGAVVASDELMKTCPGNAYCVAGAAVLRVLDAIFGSSSSEASYLNITDINIVDDYQRDMKIKKAWATSYIGQNEEQKLK